MVRRNAIATQADGTALRTGLWRRKATINELQQLVKVYPKVPQLKNFLSAAYSSNGNRQKAAEMNVRIDIKTETIHKGSPHTLRLTKTQDAYRNALARWEADVDLLKQLEALLTVG